MIRKIICRQFPIAIDAEGNQHWHFMNAFEILKESEENLIYNNIFMKNVDILDRCERLIIALILGSKND